MNRPRRRPQRATRCMDCGSALATAEEIATRSCDACRPDETEARHASRGFTHPADTD